MLWAIPVDLKGISDGRTIEFYFTILVLRRQYNEFGENPKPRFKRKMYNDLIEFCETFQDLIEARYINIQEIEKVMNYECIRKEVRHKYNINSYTK